MSDINSQLVFNNMTSNFPAENNTESTFSANIFVEMKNLSVEEAAEKTRILQEQYAHILEKLS